MTKKTKLILHVAIGVVGYLVWALMAYLDPTLRHDFLVFNIGMATGTIGLALRDMATSPAAPVSAVTDPAPMCPRMDKQAGRASSFLLLLMATATLVLLPACSLMSARVSAIEEGTAQTVVQSSERTICRDIPIGTWLRLYGANADRLKGWQSLCFNPVTAPLNADTIAAILKVYPGFVAPTVAATTATTVQSASVVSTATAVQSTSTTDTTTDSTK